MNLTPAKEVGHYIISSPSHFVGDFIAEDLRIDHCWPDFNDRAQWTAKMTESPYSRHFYVVSVENPIKQSETVLTSRSYLAELVASLAAVWFGKSFKTNGSLIENGLFTLPMIEPYQPLTYKTAPCFNSSKRIDLDIELNWSNFQAPYRIMELPQDTKELRAFWNSLRYYNSALNYFEFDPEIAFFLMISALEFIGAACDVPEAELYDPDLNRDFEAIKMTSENGTRIVDELKKRLYQLRRRIGWISKQFLNDYFFSHTESSVPFGALNQESIPRVFRDAYDLRSSYAHDGKQFANAIKPLAQLNNEVLIGDSGYKLDGKFVSQVKKGNLTFLGLERSARFIILSFCHNHILNIDERLSRVSSDHKSVPDE